ncbi:PAS domain-containing protein [Nibribacter ruber]|uniref:histidine kinase n=1 Tax=Nibribacter ruber TaxID=2698458 RepID=A0A6P1P2F1_9BACT|nr:PAS domain-containing protein [Nibribacter ruber]QHL88586.1 PAS domain-containing protein [Nibribacter ruber]
MTVLSASSIALDLGSIFRALPSLHLILSPDFIILEASDTYLANTFKTRSILGEYVFDVFPDNPQQQDADGVQNLKLSLEYALQYKEPHKMEVQRYDILHGTDFEIKYWQALNTPVLSPTGNVLYLVHTVEDITARYLQEKEQDLVKGSMNVIVEASGGVSWEYDIKNERFFWGENFEQVFGHCAPADGEPPSIWETRVHPQDYPLLRANIRQGIEKREKVWRGKYRFLKANGHYTQVIDHGYILYNEEGEPYRMMGTLLDVEQQQETQRLAKENLERFELMAKATNDVIWDWNLLDDSIWWNDGFKVTFGYQDKDIEHDVQSWYSRLHPEDTARVMEGIHKVIDSDQGIHWQDEYRFRKADGSYADIFDRGIIARDPTGKPHRMIGAMMDLTEKNKSAADLKASEEHVRGLLEGIPAIAWVAGADGYIHYYNKAWYTYTGTSTAEQGWEAIVHPEDLAATQAAWQKALATGKEYVNEARLRRAADGQYRYFTMRATPLRDQAGTIQTWIGVDTDIQEQKDIQQKLRERDEYVKRMLSQSPVQFAVLKGANWLIDFATPQFKQLVGSRDIVGKPFKSALSELKSQGFFEIIENVYATGRTYVGNESPAFLDRTGNGQLELGYFNFVYQPLFDEHHAVEGIMILIVEVTEQVLVRQEAEQLAQDLKVSHERTLHLLEALPHMTFTTLPTGDVDYYSPKWYDGFLGTSFENLKGWGWQNYLHPDDLERTITQWKKALATGHEFEIENRWRSKTDGQYRWFLIRGVPIRDAGDTIIQWVGTHTYIEDQKRMLLALEESTKNFMFLADSMPQLVWTTDPAGYHDYFNRQWIEYTGYDVEASKGDTMWNNLVHPEDQARASARWQHSLRTGEPYEVEYRFKRARDGEWRWFLGRALPQLNADGLIVKWFGTCTDIEDQKHNEALMEQTNLELMNINEDLDSFVYTASHDLKLPIINMASIFKELTHSATFQDPDANLLIGMFNKSLTQIQGTIHDLAEIVKVQKNIDAQQEEVVLDDLVNEVKLSIQDLLHRNDAHITTQFVAAPSLNFSRVNLKSILYNLVSNAVKYRSPLRTPEVTIFSEREGDYLVLTVQDNGMGLDMERHGAKLFQMFKRFHNHVDGSGLGLYIVNRIMQKNGGRIDVQSQLGQGTTFTLYFKESL